MNCEQGKAEGQTESVMNVMEMSPSHSGQMMLVRIDCIKNLAMRCNGSLGSDDVDHMTVNGTVAKRVSSQQSRSRLAVLILDMACLGKCSLYTE